jgi:hypothetical protein
MPIGTVRTYLPSCEKALAATLMAEKQEKNHHDLHRFQGPILDYDERTAEERSYHSINLATCESCRDNRRP